MGLKLFTELIDAINKVDCEALVNLPKVKHVAMRLTLDETSHPVALNIHPLV